MEFQQNLIEGRLIRRYRRFYADVRLRDGGQITVHCAHPGSMMGCCEPGSRVLLSIRDDPRSKHKHQMEVIYSGRTAVGIHTGRPAALVSEALMGGRLAELAGYAKLKRDPPEQRRGGADFVLLGNALRPCYIVVKSVTMARNGVAYYPDALMSSAGIRQMAELTDLVREGNRAMLLFIATRSDVERWRPADDVDAEFATAFRDAHARGVEALCYKTKITKRGIELDKKIPVEIEI